MQSSSLAWSTTSRGMRGPVHVRVSELLPDDVFQVVANTEWNGNPFPDAPKARAYAMRWKHGGRKRGVVYAVEFAEVR